MSNKMLSDICQNIYKNAKVNMEGQTKHKNIDVIRNLGINYLEQLNKLNITKIKNLKPNGNIEEYFVEKLNDNNIVAIKFECLCLEFSGSKGCLTTTIIILTLDLKNNNKNVITINNEGITNRKNVSRLPRGFKEVFNKLNLN